VNDCQRWLGPDWGMKKMCLEHACHNEEGMISTPVKLFVGTNSHGKLLLQALDLILRRRPFLGIWCDEEKHDRHKLAGLRPVRTWRRKVRKPRTSFGKRTPRWHRIVRARGAHRLIRPDGKREQQARFRQAVEQICERLGAPDFIVHCRDHASPEI
jgi:hypothetical protein